MAGTCRKVVTLLEINVFATGASVRPELRHCGLAGAVHPPVFLPVSATLLHAPREAPHLLFLDKGHNILFRRRAVTECADDLPVASLGVFAGAFFARNSEK